MKKAIKICLMLSLLNAAPFFLPATASAEALVYSWNMDADPGWTIEGLWAWGQPAGGGGEHGGPDPTSGYTGSNVYGYNLSGDYENDLPETHLTSTVIDCTGLYNVTLKFRRWLGVEESPYDHAYVHVSNDDSTWTQVWENDDSDTADSSWVLVEKDISSIANFQPKVYLRWTMGTTDDAYRYCGWNIDDVEIWAISAPTSTTGSATSVLSTSATLNGTVNPNGASTTVSYKYGRTTAYGSTAAAVQSPLSGSGAQAVSAAIGGLDQGATYHYCVVAENSRGETEGSDRSFTTPIPYPACSGAIVELENVTFHSGGNWECTASTSISLGPGVTVESGSTVTFQAPTVKVKPGFHAKPGAKVIIPQP